MNFTSKEFNEFRKDLIEATKELSEKYKVTIQAGSISYNDLSFDLKLKVTKNEEGLDIEKEQFLKNARYYGLDESDYLKTVTIQGRQFELYGINPRAKSQPCLIRDVKNDGHYKCSLEVYNKAAGKDGHKCKYCGSWVKGNNPDELCDDCKETFGHSLYTEL